MDRAALKEYFCIRQLERLISKLDSLPRQQEGEVVYFVAEKEDAATDFLVKIGFTNNIAIRFTDLQCGNPRELELVGCYEGPAKAERIIHQAFDYLRVRGEWFKTDLYLRWFMDELCKDVYFTNRPKRGPQFVKTEAADDGFLAAECAKRLASP